MAIRVTPYVREKLERKHSVTVEEVKECFLNWSGVAFIDDSEEHFHDFPPSQWFVAETEKGRKLLVVFREENSDEWIVTAFDAGPTKIRNYERACEDL